MLNNHWITEKAREFQKNIYFCFTDYVKAFDHVDHNKLWKILKEMRVPDHLTCLLRNRYVSQKATVRTLHRMTCPKLGKEYDKAAYCHPVYLLYMESTSCKNTRLDGSQVRIRIAGRNINNLRYADDTTIMVGSEEELKILLMRLKRLA